MKILLTFFVLLFSSSVLSDDISDFQIEGMSIGGSLLDRFSITEIKNLRNYDHLPSNMKFRISWFETDEFALNMYDGMQIYYKPEDRNFIIHGINGYIKCFNKNECEKILNTMLSDLSAIFLNSKKTGGDTYIHPDDESGKSTYKNYYFELVNGLVLVSYIDWSNEVLWDTHVRVELNTNEVSEWIQNGYF